MDVGADLNAKCAIMDRKTVLIPGNDEESPHSGLRQHFQIKIDFIVKETKQYAQQILDKAEKKMGTDNKP